MRLLLITNVFPSPLHPTKGVFNLELVRALRRSSHDVRVICPIAWTDEVAGLRSGRHIPPKRSHAADDVLTVFPRFYFSPKILRRHYGGFMWHSVRATLRRQVAEFRPDAVIGYWAHPDGEVAVRAARLANVPAIVMVGGSDVLLMTGHGARRRCVLNVLRAADAVVPVSNNLRNKLIEFGIDSNKVHVVERGVDTSVFHPGDRDEARALVGLHFPEPMLLWVGRMVPVKGLDILLTACTKLRQRGLSFQLCLVGDGPLRGALERQADANGLRDVVRFIGVVSHHQLADWYRASDLIVLPSRSEGVPNVLREALACGKPYVASNVGGVAELGEAWPTVLVVSEDPEALAQGLVETLLTLSRIKAQAELGTSSATNWDDSAAALSRVISRLGRAGRSRKAMPC
jgi:glycosyltransferase involved in cell wall biosynthesis